MPTDFFDVFEVRVQEPDGFYPLQCHANAGLKIIQDGCIEPWTAREIKANRNFFAGDSIIVDMDKDTVTILNKYPHWQFFDF